MPDRPPPDVDRGPRRDLSDRARRLVDRASAEDRAARARTRFAEVHASEERLHRRQHVARLTGWLTAALALVGLGALTNGVVGAAAGLGVLAIAALLSRSLHRAAARRGATAWDWRARRYRLMGNPSAEVQNLDGYTGTRDALGQRRTDRTRPR